MLEVIRSTIGRYDMLKEGDCVTVALSGGADSVALLHGLHTLSPEYGITLRAVHVNHCIRGTESDSDQRYCRSLCEELGIPLRCFCCDVPALAAERGIGLEEAGREVRYRCFAEAAEDWRQEGGGKGRFLTATAHTLSDNAETVLLNLTRGCGTAGMRGIPPVRGDIVRPLIGCTREQIERYCTENRLRWVTDSTNSDTEYSRNLVRAEVIPLLRRLNPSLDGSIGRLSQAAREDDALLCSLAEEARLSLRRADGGLGADALLRQPTALRHRIIMSVIREGCDLTPSARQLELIGQCLVRGSGSVPLSDRVTAAVSGGCFRLKSAGEEAQTPSFTPLEWCGEPSLPLSDGRIALFRIINTADICEQCEENTEKRVLLFENAPDYDIICNNAPEGRLLLRPRREGDRFSPARRGVTKSVKKLLNELHIPPRERSRLVFIQQGEQLIWIEGIGAAQSCAASPKTRRLLVIDIADGDPCGNSGNNLSTN